jgi:hypothetical protein
VITIALKHRHDVLDVGLEIDLGPGQMRALTQARQRRRVNILRGVSQEPRHLRPAPAAMPRPVNEDIRADRHPS